MGTHSNFYAACTTRHESSMIPKALKFVTLQKKMAPSASHCIESRWGLENQYYVTPLKL